MKRLLTARALVLAAAAASLATAAGAYAAVRGGDARPAKKPPRTLVVSVAHGQVTAANSQYVDTAPTGPSAGDVRAYYLPLTKAGSTTEIGYLTGTLTTSAVGRPEAGMELRTADLVFVVGGAADQLVVGGVASYSQSAPTISVRSEAVRPVTGGSGKYAGARGWCVSTHLEDGTWTHVFHITLDR
jgi:hypothetical protein